MALRVLSVWVSLTTLLVACGGGAEVGSDTASPEGVSRVSEVAGADADALLKRWQAHTQRGGQYQPEALTDAERFSSHMREAGRINRESVSQGVPEGVAAASNPIPAKSGFVQVVPVFRLYNTQTSAHFYTTSEQEVASVVAQFPQFQLEGPAFNVSRVPQAGLSPVFRFFNTQTGVHFYTISEQEKAYVQANLPQLTYEGVAYYASKTGGPGFRPLYRFYRAGLSVHFFTGQHTERDRIIADLCDFQYEGIGFYAIDASVSSPPPAARRNAVVLVVGDSLSQGYGIDITGDYFSFVSPGWVWPQQLEVQLRDAGMSCARVVNVSVGGMLTWHGRVNMQTWLGQHDPTHVILAQGTNDAWQGVSLGEIRSNLNQMSQYVRESQRKLYVMELAFLRNGAGYQQTLSNLYLQVATDYSSRYINGTQGLPVTGTYYYADWVHQRNAAQAIIKDNAWRVLQPDL